VKEAVELWKEDVREKSLLVRGTRLREVPLSPFAQEVLWDWLPQRDFLASHQPLPYPHLLLIPFYAESLVLGHQWKRVCRLRVSGAFSRTRHRSATTSIISSRS
jgi:integrase